jgi:hypothetical protein
VSGSRAARLAFAPGAGAAWIKAFLLFVVLYGKPLLTPRQRPLDANT